MIRPTKILLATRALLGLLMLWFGTHHFAPGFEQPILHFGLHSHITPQDGLYWAENHPHLKHCDFCSANVFLGIALKNILPKASQQKNLLSDSTFVFVAGIPMTRFARAPPARIARQVLSYEQEAPPARQVHL